jgi:hypothetical protein
MELALEAGNAAALRMREGRKRAKTRNEQGPETKMRRQHSSFTRVEAHNEAKRTTITTT